jgi:FecR-like protein
MTTEDETNDAYLWDGSGDPTPEVARLEQALGLLRHQGTPPALPARTAQGRRFSVRRMAALAAGIVLVVATASFVIVMRRSSWDVAHVSGVPIVDGRPVTGIARLGVGGRLVTDSTSRARLVVGHIGQVDVDPNTRVQLIQARSREHRMALERGTIHARIWAPPKFFFVNTPAATAIDLGCAYTLHVNDDGSGLLKVTHGWVGFERDGREAFIPQGAMCETRPGVGPGTPRYEDAPSGYGASLTLLDFGSMTDPGRGDALALILSQARKKDALTLWHLLTRGTAEERARVYDRLASLAPPPEGVSRELALAGDPTALSLWWDSLGVETGTWWRFFKKKW